MNETTKNYCELFTANLEALKSAVKLESSYVFPVAANMLAQAGVTADPEKFKECRKLMQKKTSAFSSLTGTSELPIEVLMYLSDDPQGTYDRIKTIYEIFKKPLKGGEYGAMLAVYLYDKIDEVRAQELAVRGKALYDRFNKKHPILTSPDDGVMTTFMAMSGKSDDELFEESEAAYELIRKTFKEKGASMTCGRIFAMAGGKPEDKIQRLTELFNAIKETGRKYADGRELTVLAALSMNDTDIKVLVDEIVAIDEYLEGQKVYKKLGTGKKGRLMHAALLAGSIYGKNSPVDMNIPVAVLAAIAAYENEVAAMVAVMAAVN